DAGNATDAKRIATDVLAAARRSLPENNVRLGPPLFALARAELALGRPAEAETLAREALAIRTALLPPHDPRVLEVKVALVNALAAQARTADAAALHAELTPALASLSSSYGADLRARVGSP
ncbi:MAG TPA: tetratricopeptide repeat protein, partial [Rhodanobacteraceae bacterium]|nr:tetratricopeptide repeat protein [Rhodanobacteraceae bacterium]